MKHVITAVITASWILLLFGAAHSGDLYGVMRNPDKPNQDPGICSAVIGDGEVAIRATANNLKKRHAYSAWITAEVDGVVTTEHLDGAIGSKGKSHEFEGGIGLDTDLLESLFVQVRQHPKVKNNTSDETIIEWITTPNGGCDGTCPTVASCEMFTIL